MLTSTCSQATAVTMSICLFRFHVWSYCNNSYGSSFSEICWNLITHLSRTIKGSRAFWVEPAPSALWLMCLQTQLYSFTPPGKKNITAEWLAMERTTTAEARIWGLKWAETLCQTGSAAKTVRWYCIRRWCPSCCAQLLCKANVHCLTQFQTLTGGLVKFKAPL